MLNTLDHWTFIRRRMIIETCLFLQRHLADRRVGWPRKPAPQPRRSAAPSEPTTQVVGPGSQP